MNGSVATTNGYATTNNNSVTISVDTTNKWPSGGPGRPAVRLISDNTYTHGLFILDLNHMPYGCGTWPAFWLLGPDWPTNGEIGESNSAGYYFHTDRVEISLRVYTLVRQTPSLCIPTRIAPSLVRDKLVCSQVLIATMLRMTILVAEVWRMTLRPRTTMAKDSATMAVVSTLRSGRQHLSVFGSLLVTVSLRVSPRALQMFPNSVCLWRTSKVPATLTLILLTTVSSSTRTSVARGLDLPIRTSPSVR